jgi:uncharacterized RDD family membrane protein YckC
MKWYYVENGQQAGPVEETEFPQLSRLGKLRADTLMWHEGMANWEPFNTVCPPEIAAITAAASATLPATGVVEAVCGECGGIFDKNDMIPHGNVYICARCKPVFMQKLAEGVKLNTGGLDYAGIGVRFGAAVLDNILLYIVSFATQMFAMLVAAPTIGSQPDLALMVQIILIFVQLAIGVSYEAIMIGKYGATLGKMACKIKVVTADGGRVTYLRAFGRYFAKILSSLICLIGYFMAVFDKDERRALHDRICDTRVVMK